MVVGHDGMVDMATESTETEEDEGEDNDDHRGEGLQVLTCRGPEGHPVPVHHLALTNTLLYQHLIYPPLRTIVHGDMMAKNKGDHIKYLSLLFSSEKLK